jgi:hypothetical protein
MDDIYVQPPLSLESGGLNKKRHAGRAVNFRRSALSLIADNQKHKNRLSDHCISLCHTRHRVVFGEMLFEREKGACGWLQRHPLIFPIFPEITPG